MVLTWIGLLAGSQARAEPHLPLQFHLGHVTLIPSGFLDIIGMTRSATTPDSVSTRLGRIPLGETASQTVASLAHSRVNLHGYLPVGRVRLGGYVESDFTNPNPDSTPWRWRQYFGSVRYGSWELLGGLGWSLLRPNRAGVFSDRELMNTAVIEPSYQVGLAGARRRQVRLQRDFEKESAVLAWESNGNWVGKIVSDRSLGHLEAAGFGGRHGRAGANLAAYTKASHRLRFVGQQFWSRRDLAEALGLVPADVGGWATLAGVECPLDSRWELYSYAGEIWGRHSTGNHMVRQFSAGFNYRRRSPSLYGDVMLSLQYSFLDRHQWDGRAGSMQYLMYRMRYTFQ